MSASKRNLSVDGFRGLLLVVIAINHLESPLISSFTREPFGFVSAAEGFIFLSGLVAAMVYGRFVDQPAELKRRVWRRVLDLYAYTLVGVLLITALLHLNWLSEIWYRDWGNYFLLQNYLEHPLEALVLSALQVHQMGYLDILIAYMVPMLFLPWALQALNRGWWWLVAACSIAVWCLAQVTSDAFFQPLYHWLKPGMKVDAGYMDVFAWQLIFYSGVVFGFYARFRGVSFTAVRAVTVWVFIAAVLLAMADKLQWAEQVAVPLLATQFSWQDVGLVRYFNTLVLAYLVAILIQRQSVLLTLKPLVFLGQHSLQVFTFHAVAIYIFLPWMYQLKHSWYWDLLLTLSFVGSLFVPAWLHRQWQRAGLAK